MQLTKVAFNDAQRGGVAYFVGSIHYSDYDDKNTGKACIIQSGFAASWRPGGFLLEFTQGGEDDDAGGGTSADYSACTTTPPDTSWINRFLGSWAGNQDMFSEIDATTPDNCLEF